VRDAQGKFFGPPVHGEWADFQANRLRLFGSGQPFDGYPLAKGDDVHFGRGVSGNYQNKHHERDIQKRIACA
jgi:hypothetical protein